MHAYRKRINEWKSSESKANRIFFLLYIFLYIYINITRRRKVYFIHCVRLNARRCWIRNRNIFEPTETNWNNSHRAYNKHIIAFKRAHVPVKTLRGRNKSISSRAVHSAAFRKSNMTRTSMISHDNTSYWHYTRQTPHKYDITGRTRSVAYYTPIEWYLRVTRIRAWYDEIDAPDARQNNDTDLIRLVRKKADRVQIRITTQIYLQNYVCNGKNKLCVEQRPSNIARSYYVEQNRITNQSSDKYTMYDGGFFLYVDNIVYDGDPWDYT